MENFLIILEMIGTIAFAISGATVGIKSRMDVLGVTILGVTTAIGGGIMRDIILGLQLPSSFSGPRNLYVSTLVAMATFVFVYYNKRVKGNNINRAFDAIMLITDAIGLAVFTVLGMDVAFKISLDFPFPLYIFVGVITGVGGGVVRDILAQTKPFIFYKHVYASASIIGAVLYYLLRGALPAPVPMLISMITIITIRLCAYKFKWNLPKVQ